MSITDTTVGEPRSAHDNRVAIAELYLRARTNALLGQNLGVTA